MKAGDSPEHGCVVNHEQVAKHSSTKSVERLVKRSIKVSDSQSHSLASWASKSYNYEAVAEIPAEIAECTNTTKSCNAQNTLMQNLKESAHKELKNEHDQDCNLQNTELDGTAVQEISTREHFESLDISQVSDFWDQVQMKIATAI